uniref:Uncharacterized protein n=1 Tax=Anguilla anguilla TaxID=7936 RepID=A0A0E9W1U2_ANGAN
MQSLKLITVHYQLVGWTSLATRRLQHSYVSIYKAVVHQSHTPPY